MKKPLPTPEAPSPPSPEPNSVLGMHHRNLKQLSEELHDMERLFAMWTDLSTQLETAETEIAGTVTEILAGEANDVAFNEKSIKIASLSAQLAAIKKRTVSSGTALQAKLEKDCIAPTEWLVGLWLEHRLNVQVTQLLALVAPERRGLVREACYVLGEATTSYNASVAQLGTPAPVSYSWQRPLESVSDKNLSGLGMVRDPLWKPVDMREILTSLLEAGKIQVARWTALLGAIATDPGFVPPSSYEEPKPEQWTPPKELAGVSAGPPREGIEVRAQPRIKYDWTEDDLKVPEFPIQQAS